MKVSPLFIVLLLTALRPLPGAERLIAFARHDNDIYVCKADGTSVRKVADGIFPAMSPDGARIAFNTVEKSGTTYRRHIAVANIATGKTTVFKEVPSENS